MESLAAQRGRAGRPTPLPVGLSRTCSTCARVVVRSHSDVKWDTLKSYSAALTLGTLDIKKECPKVAGL